MIPFVPLVRDPRALTVLANFWPGAPDERLFPSRHWWFRPAPGVEVLIVTQQPPSPFTETVLVHGLEGSANSRYMRTAARVFLQAGHTVHRFHLRSCGAENRCHTYYHAGLTADLEGLLRGWSRPVNLVGFSLGGNVVLKLAGELRSEGPRYLRAVAAVSTPLDLAACAGRIAEPANRLFERRFLKSMTRRVRASRSSSELVLRNLRSIRDFDEHITAALFGFGTAQQYYQTQSASQFLESIRVPTLLIQARDDLFIPFSCFNHQAFTSNPHLHLLATEYGGHVGFIARSSPHLWVEHVLTAWLAQPA